MTRGLGVFTPPCCAALSRRRFGKLAAGTAGLAAGAGMGWPSLAHAQQVGGAAPRPIPSDRIAFGRVVHHFGPPADGPNRLQEMGDQSNITDFDGVVTANRVTGTGRGTDTRTGVTRAMPFRADVGFMQGTYVGEDGVRRQGTFAFT